MRLIERPPGVEEPLRTLSGARPFPTTGNTPHELVAPHETAVYRFYDDDSRLLYVGITWNPYRRWETHRGRRAMWWHQASRVVVDVYPTERSALRAEREWIAWGRPIHNVRSNM